MQDEWERIRDRGRPEGTTPPGEAGPRTFAGRVTSTGADLDVGNFVLVQPFTVSGDPTPVAWIGPADPATGDRVVAKWAGARWVAGKRSPGGCGGTLTVHVQGCFGAGVAGASVTISLGGSTVASGTTGSGGTIAFPVAASGSYTVDASMTGRTSATATVSVACGIANSATLTLTGYTTTINLSAHCFGYPPLGIGARDTFPGTKTAECTWSVPTGSCVAPNFTLTYRENGLWRVVATGSGYLYTANVPGGGDPPSFTLNRPDFTGSGSDTLLTQCCPIVVST